MPVQGCRSSPYLQDKLALLGCLTVYKQVPEVVGKLLGIEVNQAQVYRICQSLSPALPAAQLNAPSPALARQQSQPKSIIYGMVDGSMLFTDSGCQETKLGRVFVAQPEGKTCLRPQIECSEYIAQRGHYSGFTLAFEQLLPPLSPAQKVFVTDGAEWIAHWLAATYTNAIHILDYFHVVEKLAVVAKGLPHGRKWLATQQGYLLDNQSEQVEKNVAGLSRLAVGQRDRLVEYLLNNRHRMRYGDYRKHGLLIGSGPIEAAHWTVLQVRMKRSGQR